MNHSMELFSPPPIPCSRSKKGSNKEGLDNVSTADEPQESEQVETRSLLQQPAVTLRALRLVEPIVYLEAHPLTHPLFTRPPGGKDGHSE